MSKHSHNHDHERPGMLASHERKLVATLIVVPVVGLVILAGLLLFWDSFINPEGANLISFNPQDNWSAGAAANPTTPPANLRKFSVVNAASRHAVCNDGTAAIYYFRPGIEQFKDKWVIYLQGGGACSSDEECLQRRIEDPRLVSSNGFSPTTTEGGILSTSKTNNPDFYGWNHVKMHYCSSDTWIGDMEKDIGGSTWYFHGKDIVKSVLEDLQNPAVIQTANLTSASQVIFAGSSAGGGGAIQNLDRVSAMLPWAQVKGLIDSSWSPVVGRYDGTPEPDPTTYFEYNNRLPDESCMAANTGNRGFCAIDENLQPYIETPTFTFINQRDNLKLGNKGVSAPFDTSETTWINTVFIPRIIDSFNQIEASDGLYSPNLTFHTSLTSDRFYQPYLSGQSLARTFGNWYFGRQGSTRLIGQ